MTAVVADPFESVRRPVLDRPFPFAALVAVSRSTQWELVRELGISGSAFSRARTEGLTWEQADRWAVAIGRHPAEVWPDLWYPLIELEDDE